MHRLFTYGTLQLPRVQETLFGRLVPMTPDALTGYRREEIAVGRDEVIDTSETKVHPILVPDESAAPIQGMVLELSTEELAAADRYEEPEYRRVTVRLESGLAADVYVIAE